MGYDTIFQEESEASKFIPVLEYIDCCGFLKHTEQDKSMFHPTVCQMRVVFFKVSHTYGFLENSPCMNT